MDFSVNVEGLDKLASNLGMTPKIIESEISKALFASAQHVATEAKKSLLEGGKSGRIYKRRTVTHRASAPGEAPASDTGRLVNSINSYLDTTVATSFVIAGRGTAKYASMLEFGTSRIAPRPFMNPALQRSLAWIKSRLADAGSRAVDRAGKS